MKSPCNQRNTISKQIEKNGLHFIDNQRNALLKRSSNYISSTAQKNNKTQNIQTHKNTILARMQWNRYPLHCGQMCIKDLTWQTSRCYPQNLRKACLQGWSLACMLEVPKTTPGLKIHIWSFSVKRYSKISKGKRCMGEVQGKPAQASRVSKELPWQTTLHMYCHNSILKEASMSCVTPLDQDF